MSNTYPDGKSFEIYQKKSKLDYYTLHFLKAIKVKNPAAMSKIIQT